MIRDYINGVVKSLSGDDKLQRVGIGDFIAYVAVDESVSYVADIPEEVVEDGSTAATDIIIKPITIKISGRVGDVIREPDPITQLQNRINSELGKVSTYLPARSSAQISRMQAMANTTQDRLRKIDQAIDDGKSAASFFGLGNSSKPLGEQFIDAMEAYYYGKQIITVSVPYKQKKSMAISSMSISRNNEDAGISFSIDFKEVRTADIKLVDVTAYFKRPAPAAQGKTQPTADKGAQEPKASPKSILSFLTGG